MKLIAVVVALISGALLPAVVSARTTEEKCTIIADVAESIMLGRQAGADKNAVLEKVQVPGEPDISLLFEIMVQEAYSTDRVSNPKQRQQLSSEFAQQWKITCLRELSAL
ncbi:hypothetical protein ACLPHM_05090 [Paenalcaligenes sp. Me131]|uniref:hypothetical protein n=1 Tax=Paenalcaligenes sp. Me131 TaxID=3392636 RepID=UPI003D2C2E00